MSRRARVYCEHIVMPLTVDVVTRNVYYQTPLGQPPAAGWPTALIYQGSLYGPSVTWDKLDDTFAHGGFYQGLLQAMLLDNGFAVIAPAAGGELAWTTNAGG